VGEHDWCCHRNGGVWDLVDDQCRGLSRAVVERYDEGVGCLVGSVHGWLVVTVSIHLAPSGRFWAC
jgi:hypothetical protein